VEQWAGWSRVIARVKGRPDTTSPAPDWPNFQPAQVAQFHPAPTLIHRYEIELAVVMRSATPGTAPSGRSPTPSSRQWQHPRSRRRRVQRVLARAPRRGERPSNSVNPISPRVAPPALPRARVGRSESPRHSCVWAFALAGGLPPVAVGRYIGGPSLPSDRRNRAVWKSPRRAARMRKGHFGGPISYRSDPMGEDPDGRGAPGRGPFRGRLSPIHRRTGGPTERVRASLKVGTLVAARLPRGEEGPFRRPLSPIPAKG
jgi:hypothetical protein